MAIGIRGAHVEYGESTVAVSALGAGTTAVTFATAGTAFTSTPDVLVVGNDADVTDGASYTAASVTKTGFTVTVASSNLISRDIRVKWFAHERD